MASHYRSNLRDLEFNLFEVNRIQDYLGSEPWPDLDEATARDILTEIERLAREVFAASYVDQDRIPLELVDGEVHLPESIKAGVAAYKEGGWDRLAAPAEMGGMPVPPSLAWATQEMQLAANTTVSWYSGGTLFATVLFEEGNEWQKELAPSSKLRAWFGHEPVRFAEFRRRYIDELRANRSRLKKLRRRARHGTLTLVYSARDSEHNDAVVLAEVLRRGLLKPEGPRREAAVPSTAPTIQTVDGAARRSGRLSRRRPT